MSITELIVLAVYITDVKSVFYVLYYFYKNAFLTFLFLERFLFSSGEFFYPAKPLKSY